MTRQWFKTSECTSLQILKYKSVLDPQVMRSVDVEDSSVVKKIIDRIERIDPDGKLAQSAGADDEHIDLLFRCKNEKVQKIEVYGHQFKTPSKGFNAGENKEELSLYSDIDALLLPVPGKRILKIKHLALKFKDFTLVYLGATKSDSAPLTVSWNSDRFLIKDNNGSEQIIDITSGQLPPKPYDFDIGTHEYALLTHHSESKERLYPDYFEIIRRN